MIDVVVVLRTSTEDKGQDPERQMEKIGSWAACNGANIVGVVIDEGTSASKTNPLDRQKVIEACDLARSLSARGLLFECADRFSRQGAKLHAWAEVELERKHGLALYLADKPLSQHGTMVGAVGDAIHAEAGHAWVEEHRSKVKSGMARKKAAGAKFGRPAKPLSASEIALVAKLLSEGKGWGKSATAVNVARGAHLVVDRRVRGRLEVSGSHVRRAVLTLAVRALARILGYALPEVAPVRKV